MNSILTKAALMFAVALLWAQQAQAQQIKLATIDFSHVFTNYWKFKQAESVLNDKAKDLENDQKKMVEQYNKVKGDYRTALEKTNDAAVSADEREKRKKAAEGKLGEMKELEATINQFDRQAMSILDEQKRRMRDNLVAEIKGIVDLKAKSGGYSLVIDSSAVSGTGTPIVAYNANDSDLTKVVLNQLNETAPANRVVPGATPPPVDKEKK
ncbi:MAG: OmpH family outer membrane protein [Verrucomicrobia bacterium]|nr:OmpH family outer membrane protein [Verrucomicrobiota bacterium]MBI3867116.1 OmpH family outer membrane protein [Verrucomicrobiota bacterium]